MTGNPYEHQALGQTPSGAFSNKLFWLVLGGGFITTVLLCCGGTIVLGRFGLGVLAADIEMQLRDHPVIQVHIGQIEELSVNFTRSAALEDTDTFIYEIRGNRGSGELTVTSHAQWIGDQEQIVAATLRLENGEVIELEFAAEASSK